MSTQRQVVSRESRAKRKRKLAESEKSRKPGSEGGMKKTHKVRGGAALKPGGKRRDGSLVSMAATGKGGSPRGY